MFAFENNVKQAFRVVKNEFSQLKMSINDWITFLNNRRKDHDVRIVALEERVKFLETRVRDAEHQRVREVERDVLELRNL